MLTEDPSSHHTQSYVARYKPEEAGDQATKMQKYFEIPYASPGNSMQGSTWRDIKHFLKSVNNGVWEAKYCTEVDF